MFAGLPELISVYPMIALFDVRSKSTMLLNQLPPQRKEQPNKSTNSKKVQANEAQACNAARKTANPPEDLTALITDNTIAFRTSSDDIQA